MRCCYNFHSRDHSARQTYFIRQPGKTGRIGFPGQDMNSEDLLKMLMEKAAGKTAVLALDGRCAAGKSTLAGKLADRWGAALFHMDDFYLQPKQRTKERLAEPGGNVDRERFLAEVLEPLRAGKTVEYRRFDCRTMSFENPRLIPENRIAIVEGSYACHPELRGYYDLRIFLDIDPETQLERIRRRNGPEGAERFRNIWIPLEEAYFNGCRVRECCDLVLSPSETESI